MTRIRDLVGYLAVGNLCYECAFLQFEPYCSFLLGKESYLNHTLAATFAAVVYSKLFHRRAFYLFHEHCTLPTDQLFNLEFQFECLEYGF